TARNEKLRQQLVAARSEQAKASILAPPAKVADTSGRHLNVGDRLFKERRYKEALDEFITASKMDPASALAANNVGYVYYKMNKFDDAIAWYEKTIKIDPNRDVAYANLGDLYYQLDRTADARRVYEKYLEIAPNSTYAPTVRSRLAK